MSGKYIYWNLKSIPGEASEEDTQTSLQGIGNQACPTGHPSAGPSVHAKLCLGNICGVVRLIVLINIRRNIREQDFYPSQGAGGLYGVRILYHPHPKIFPKVKNYDDSNENTDNLQ